MRANRYRTHTCGELGAAQVGQSVRIAGWVHAIRDHKGIFFFDLRDRYGVTQVVAGEGDSQALRDIARNLTPESVLTVHGVVRPRPEQSVVEAMPTGKIEVVAEQLEVHSLAAPLPFQVRRDDMSNEDLRLKYRFLDLRRQRMQQNIALRARIISFLRNFMDAEGFLDIHTPILANSSPEGARDFLVPSRLHPGMFYALPQAPQQFKQLLMVAGFDRYYQIAPCFRDEDARADRSPGEFYQLDLEMSFAEMEDVFDVCERLFISLTEHFGKKVWKKPFPRFEYEDLLARFGSDKPDLRLGMEIQDLTQDFAQSEFRILKSAAADGRAVRGLCVRNGATMTSSAFKRFEAEAKAQGAKGLLAFGFKKDSPLGMANSERLSEAERKLLADRFGATTDDLVLMVADKPKAASLVLGAVRRAVGQEFVKT
ncbi:MAG TPA: aspartate--tRNA ligase, partial [Polyangiaceae bacterium]|nr:aspartate--tRNA ligase [Polyangiaceae bacterium]